MDDEDDEDDAGAPLLTAYTDADVPPIINIEDDTDDVERPRAARPGADDNDNALEEDASAAAPMGAPSDMAAITWPPPAMGMWPATSGEEADPGPWETM